MIDDRAFRLAAGDLATAGPDGVGHVLAGAAARLEEVELPAELVNEVARRARELGDLIAVRSSATIEDGDAGAGAGVFSSRTAVPAADVWPAIRAVWASALTPLAASYARRRDATIAIGVIVQRFVAGERLVVYTRPPGAPDGDELWIQRAGRIVRLPRSDRAIGPLAIAVERAIGASAGADVELVIPPPDLAPNRPTGALEEHEDDDAAGDLGVDDLDFERAWLVQARPIVHPSSHPRTPPPPGVLAPLDDGRRWTWDVAHNPDPLSPAQVGLVERIERSGIAPWSLRVCAGYLYSTPREPVPHPAPPRSLRELEARAGELETRLELALGDPEPSLGDAIERYVAFYRIWANELVPLIAASRGMWPPLAGDRPSAVEATLFAAARGELDEAMVLDRLGVMSPAWDVAVATFAERPGLIRDAIARARAALPLRLVLPMTPELRDAIRLLQLSRTELRERIDDEVRGEIPDNQPRPSTRAPMESDVAVAAADLAERDDLWFARAQWLVRHAILTRAQELGISGDAACWLPLDELATATSLDADSVPRRAAGARAAAARAARWAMPVVVGGPPLEAGPVLHGIGTGARVTGRVVRFASLASAVVVGAGDVVVTRAVTPALAVIVIGCAAIVSETGGPLDHGAAMARELGIACVVGCRDAWSLLSDGMIVTVDGNAGTVTR